MRKILVVEVCDAVICDANSYPDHRGCFQELFSQNELPFFKCLQINCSVSKKNVLRGLHIVPFGKLVHCVKGRIFDVIADVRKDSPTYLQWYGLELSCDNRLSVYVPPNCAHGFLSLEDDSTVIYAQDGLYDPKLESSVNYADPRLNIKWPNLIVSEKDLKAPFIDNCDVES